VTQPIVHIVTWRLNGRDNDERRRQAATIVAAFDALRPLVPGLLQLDVGANIVDAADAWDVAAVMVFADRGHLDAYNAHPDHLAIKALVAPLRSARGQIDFHRGPS
jgi:hypothetical protein